MMALFRINLRTELVLNETEVTGEPCFYCGDTPYLAAHSVRMKAWADEQYVGEKQIAYLCPTCAEALQEEIGHEST